ncbi:trimeric autotransporter adhesin BpaC [Flavobacteriaceae bacterium GF1]
MKKVLLALFGLFLVVVNAQNTADFKVRSIAPTVADAAAMNAITGTKLTEGTTVYRLDTATYWVYDNAQWNNTGVGASGGGSGATQLSQLTDVNLATPTAGNILRANGTQFTSDRLNFSDLDGSLGNDQVALDAGIGINKLQDIGPDVLLGRIGAAGSIQPYGISTLKNWLSFQASEIDFTPYLTITSTNTQAALQELKDEVDGISGGGASSPELFLKENVSVATTANITLSGTQAIDGVNASSGVRVLVKDQTNASENGIYVASTGAWTRAEDANTTQEVSRTLVYVLFGSANANKFFQTNFATPNALGVQDVVFNEVDLYASGGGGSLTVQDEGIGLATGTTTLNFTGGGVTASGTGAIKTINIPVGPSTGLEALDEGAGPGWRPVGRNAANYGNIGQDAVDFSVSLSTSETYGATGWNSFASGENQTASGSNSFLAGGFQNTANGLDSFVGGGFQNTASNTYSFVAGGLQNTASGRSSFVGGGFGNTAPSFGEVVVGTYSTLYSQNSSSFFDAADRVFNVGNGASTANRSDALTILKSGLITAPSLTNALITSSASDQVLLTRGWFNANSGVTTGIKGDIEVVSENDWLVRPNRILIDNLFIQNGTETAGHLLAVSTTSDRFDLIDPSTLVGSVDQTANYTWTGNHVYQEPVTLKKKTDTNNTQALIFQNEATTVTDGALAWSDDAKGLYLQNLVSNKELRLEINGQLSYNGQVNIGTNQLTVGAIASSNNIETSQAVVAQQLKLNPQTTAPFPENGKLYSNNSGDTFLGVGGAWERITTTADGESGIQSDLTGQPTGAEAITNMVKISQSNYDAGTPVAGTEYIIKDPAAMESAGSTSIDFVNSDGYAVSHQYYDNTINDFTSFSLVDMKAGYLLEIYLNQATEPTFTPAIANEVDGTLDWTTDNLANTDVTLYVYYNGRGTYKKSYEKGN